MTPRQLDARRDEVQVVDVRWLNEWGAGRIDGALHIPQDELEDRLDELDRSRPLVTVCRSGDRSSSAAERLSAEGFRAESLDGGLEAWTADGLALVADDGKAGEVVDPEPPSDPPVEHQRILEELAKLLPDLEERFGDREATEEEVQDFLRQRLVDEGRTPDEADQYLRDLGG